MSLIFIFWIITNQLLISDTFIIEINGDSRHPNSLELYQYYVRSNLFHNTVLLPISVTLILSGLGENRTLVLQSPIEGFNCNQLPC